jgi:hypothetical protein
MGSQQPFRPLGFAFFLATALFQTAPEAGLRGHMCLCLKTTGEAQAGLSHSTVECDSGYGVSAGHHTRWALRMS